MFGSSKLSGDLDPTPSPDTPPSAYKSLFSGRLFTCPLCPKNRPTMTNYSPQTVPQRLTGTPLALSLAASNQPRESQRTSLASLALFRVRIDHLLNLVSSQILTACQHGSCVRSILLLRATEEVPHPTLPMNLALCFPLLGLPGLPLRPP